MAATGNPGMFNSDVCDDFTIFPFGRRMDTGEDVGCIFNVAYVSCEAMKCPVAPVSALASGGLDEG
jgi:hypothetical protein